MHPDIEIILDRLQKANPQLTRSAAETVLLAIFRKLDETPSPTPRDAKQLQAEIAALLPPSWRH